jgi:hypothetical protein
MADSLVFHRPHNSFVAQIERVIRIPHKQEDDSLHFLYKTLIFLYFHIKLFKQQTIAYSLAHKTQTTKNEVIFRNFAVS